MGKCFNKMNEFFRDLWDKWDNLNRGIKSWMQVISWGKVGRKFQHLSLNNNGMERLVRS